MDLELADTAQPATESRDQYLYGRELDQYILVLAARFIIQRLIRW